MTTLGWLRRHATANTPSALLDVLAKIEWLREREIHRWDLSALTPNRLKLLARLGRRYTNQALQRATPERRYPILVALLQHTLLEAVDEAVDVFDACLAGVFARSKRACAKTMRPSPAAPRRKSASSTTWASSCSTRPSEIPTCG